MRSVVAPSLLRALVARHVMVSVLALVVVVAVAIYESNELILGQFEDESGILAEVALNEINDQAELATRAAALAAGLPTTRQLTEDRDAEGLTTFLIPVKSRIGVDLMNVADNDGRIRRTSAAPSSPSSSGSRRLKCSSPGCSSMSPRAWSSARST